MDHGLWLVMIMVIIIMDWPFILFELLCIPGTVLPLGYSLWLLSYKPFMWCRSDARLRHALYYYPFEASLQTPDRCILFLPYYCIVKLWIKCLCASWVLFFVTDVVIIEYFWAWLSSDILYLCSQCLRVHSKYSLACPWLLSWPDFLRGEEHCDDSPGT